MTTQTSRLLWMACVVGVIGFVLTEIANVYFIMPMPGSQQMRSIDAAYAIYAWRWPLRVVFGAMALAGAVAVWRTSNWRRWLAPVAIVAAGLVAYVVNFKMSADHMFLQPSVLNMQPATRNAVKLNRLVVGLNINGDARAYPLQFIGYHHQVRDNVGGRNVLVSYCTVCRTGRVFVPVVAGKQETFRLVGMDHFNAMLEDKSTGSWWRQANGEAIAGKMKGTALPEIPRLQVTLAQWLALYPNSLVMQGDSTFADEYAKNYRYERGWSTSKLTGTDTASWRDKSWVVGVSVNQHSKAYDWNRLRRERVVNDVIGGMPVVVVLGPDSLSYFAFRRPDASTRFALRGDSLVADGHAYALSGIGDAGHLELLNASQEFWHSWRTFQPGTERY
ncbi:MAG: DUF3179 domain-containing (seleno)protein [bacterium]